MQKAQSEREEPAGAHAKHCKFELIRLIDSSLLLADDKGDHPGAGYKADCTDRDEINPSLNVDGVRKIWIDKVNVGPKKVNKEQCAHIRNWQPNRDRIPPENPEDRNIGYDADRDRYTHRRLIRAGRRHRLTSAANLRHRAMFCNRAETKTCSRYRPVDRCMPSRDNERRECESNRALGILP